MEGANQPGIGSGGDEYDYIIIDPDFLRCFLEDDDGLGKPDSAGGSLDQPSVDASKDGPDVSIVDSNTTIATSSEGCTTKTQERKRKKTEVSSDICLDDVRQFSELSRREAASKLKVSESTLKRVCRKYGIHRWPPHGIDKEERFPVAVPSTGDIVPHDSPGDIGITRRPYQQNGGGAVARGKTGVKIELPLEDVLRYYDMKLADAARKLKVCSATLKRICKEDYGIHRWPPRNINKGGSPWPSHVEHQEGISQSTSNMPSNQVSTSVAHTKLHDTAFQETKEDTVTVYNKVSTAYFVETSRIAAASR